MNNIKYLNNGRSALDLGIKILSIKKGSSILVPEIICDVAVEVIIRNKLNVVFYKLDNKFQPVWSDLYKKSSNNVSCVLMVHFFGYPQDLKKFLKFTRRKKISLIEDNCHSLNIKYKGSTLGFTGDIGIDSPRKILNDLYCGGRLFINVKKNYTLKNIKKYKPSLFFRIKNKVKKQFPNLIKKIKFLGNRPNYESPYLYTGKDKNFSIEQMDEFSKNKLRKINLNEESLKRIKIFNKINAFAKKNEIKSVFKINKNFIPMHFVGLAKNQNHVKKIFDWGWKNNIEVLSWPSFYKNKNLNKNLIKKWRKYICIPLNQNLHLKNINIKMNIK